MDGTFQTMDGTFQTMDGTFQTMDGTFQTIEATFDLFNIQYRNLSLPLLKWSVKKHGCQGAWPIAAKETVKIEHPLDETTFV